MLLRDLAIILITAGVVALVFKRLKQPLVLGYILAGFLVGPQMQFLPTVANPTTVKICADIGVIFLMFTLGLEFSVKKIVKMGIAPIIAATCIMGCMIGVGSTVGNAFGWSNMDSLFLGGMLAMSSTTIIYKAFDELGLRSQKFAGDVMSVLILEDILGILLMVILSAVSVSKTFEGAQLAMSLGQLAFFLVLAFVLGIVLIPPFFKWARKIMNHETLLLVSIGLCFLLVVLAEHVGYSSALGAFMMGSILAETLEAESIERVSAPLKDLFGAVFFVSVGMLVDPQLLLEYWLPILIISLAIIIGQTIFGTMSFLLSGSTLRDAMRCSFSLTQIGEFAFIIAAMGESKGVISPFLSPVVIAVSVLTTFATPYMIRAAIPTYNGLTKLLPFMSNLEERKQGKKKTKVVDLQTEQPWKWLIKELALQIVAYSILLIAVGTLCINVFDPLLDHYLPQAVSTPIGIVLCFLLASPFLRAIVMRKNHSNAWKIISQRGKGQSTLLYLTFVMRFCWVWAASYYTLHRMAPMVNWWLSLIITLSLVLLAIYLRPVKYASIRLERMFIQNLRTRDQAAQANEYAKRPGYAGRLHSRNIHIARLTVPEQSKWAGKTLAALGKEGKLQGIHIAAVMRGDTRFNIPSGTFELYPGDIIDTIGDDTTLELFAHRMESEIMTQNQQAEPLELKRVVIRADHPFANKPLSKSGLRNEHHLMLVGFEENADNIILTKADQVLAIDSVIWVVGEPKYLNLL